MQKDLVDVVVDKWQEELPELDPSGYEIVARISRLGKLLEESASRELSRYGMALWQFDMLATLYRHGMPYRLSPGQLAKASLLTSGAMTNRIDRLEKKGLIVREAHPKDRRGVLVRLTPAGRKLIREVVEARFTEASRWGEALSGRERQTLKRLLRKLLITRPSRNVVFSEIDAAEKSTA